MEERKPMRVRLLGIGTAIGSALMFFFDPQSGKRRRHVAFDRFLAFFRQGGRRAARAGRMVGAQAYGAKQKAAHLQEEPKDYDDVTLTHKVETELFRPADIPKGNINVNVQNGIVQLRGQVDRPELVTELVEKARSIQGVRDVENLLHLPDTPAPMHQ